MEARVGIEERVSECKGGIPGEKGALIPLLQKVQSEQGYISPESVAAVAEELGVSEGTVYGVATFYAEFKLSKPGRHNLKVCLGTSCYLCGGNSLLDHISRKLGIAGGQTTPDEKFSLETIACLGCCSRSPAMSIDGVIYGNLSIDKVDDILVSLD
jgi:NADH:ubiquinone oxidoreductase subunit E